MSYEIALRFDVDVDEFARGFEAGRIWERMRVADVESLDGQAFHATNSEMIIRMLEACDLTEKLRAEIIDDVWMVLRAA